MSPGRIFWKIRRRMKRYTTTNRVVSFGGVGSTSLVIHLEDGDRDRIWYHQQDKHCFRPGLLPEVRRGLRVRACYLFGDPYLSVISIFRRGLQRRMEQAVHPDRPRRHAVIRHETLLEEYLAAGVDRFRFALQLENWTGYEGDRVSILAVKHEHLGTHIQEVLDFLECPRPFRVRPRTSRFETQPEPIRRGLESMYGDLKERVDAMPSLLRINGGRPSMGAAG